MKSAIVVLATLGLCIGHGVALAGDDCKVACDRVFTEARQLPSPNASSLYNYGSRLNQALGGCLDCAIRGVTGPSGSDSSGSRPATGPSGSGKER